MDIRSFYTHKTETETKKAQTLTISFTLPLASLAEATKTSPEWLIEHQADLSDYIRGYWVFEDDLDHDNLGMLTQAVEDVKRGGVVWVQAPDDKNGSNLCKTGGVAPDHNEPY